MATIKKKKAAPVKATKAEAVKPAAAKKSATAKKKAAAPPPEPEPYISAFKAGSRVTHAVFGAGQVLAVDGERLTIKFASSEKIILDSFVKAAAKA